MRWTKRHVRVAWTVLLSLGALGTEARAQTVDSVRQRAADFYDEGLASYLTGDYREAARAFLRANRLVPAPVALAQAVRSFHAAGDAREAGTLALQLIGHDGLPPSLRTIIEQAIANATGRFVRIDVDCDSPCSIAIDGAIEETSRFFVPPHRNLRIVARFPNGAVAEQVVRAAPGEARLLTFGEARAGSSEAGVSTATVVEGTLDFEARAIAEGDNPYRISSRSVFSRPRAAFYAVLSVSIAGGGVLTWAGLQVREAKYDLRLAENSGDAVAVARAEVNYRRDVERLRWFAVEEGGVLLAMILIAAFTDWTPHGDDDEPRTTAGVGASRSGASLAVRHHF